MTRSLRHPDGSEVFVARADQRAAREERDWPARSDPLDVLADLVAIGTAFGRDVPDHLCSDTEHAREFWSTLADARRFVRRRREGIVGEES